MTHPRHKICQMRFVFYSRIDLTLLGEVVHDKSEDIISAYEKIFSSICPFLIRFLTVISTSIVGDQVEDLDEFKRGILISLHVSGDADEDGVLDNGRVSIQRDDFVFNL